MEQKETVEEEFCRTIESFNKNSAAWKTLELRSVPSSGRAAYAHLKQVMYTKLAENCTTTYASAPALSEKDCEEEEKIALAELKRKGLLNKELSDNWKVRFEIDSFAGRADV